MTGIIKIEFAEKNEKSNINVSCTSNTDKCIIDISLDKNKTAFESLECDDEKIRSFAEQMSFCKSYISDNEPYWEKTYNILNMFKENKKNLLTYADEIHFKNLTNEVAGYISKNKELQEKKIRILETCEFDEKNISKLKRKTKNIKNIYFSFKDLSSCITLEEAEEQLNLIEKIVTDTHRYNYSPLEKLMYVYDKIKEHECPMIFKHIVKHLGFKEDNYLLVHLKKGFYKSHNRSMIYLKDEKYNIDGVYFFDPEWDMNKKYETDTTVNNYKFFCKTIDLMQYYDAYKRLVDYYNFPALQNIYSDEYHKYLTPTTFQEMPIEYRKTINSLFNFFEGKSLNIPEKNHLTNNQVKDEINTNEESTEGDIRKFFYTKIIGRKKTIDKKILQYASLFYKTIDSKTLLEALSAVRKIESKENKERYQYNYEELIKSSINSDWGDDSISKIEKLKEEERNALFKWDSDLESDIEELPIDDPSSLLETKYAATTAHHPNYDIEIKDEDESMREFFRGLLSIDVPDEKEQDVKTEN